MRARFVVALAAALAVGGCDDGGDDAAPVSDVGPSVDAVSPGDAAADAAPEVDAEADAAPSVDAGDLDGAPSGDAAADAGPADAAPDAAWVDPDPAWIVPEPAAYRVGVATRRMPVPVGIGTSGFGANSADRSVTPFAQVYPGTQRIHTHPDLRALVIEAGEGNRLIIVRTDTVGVSAALRRSLVARLQSALGERVDHQLVLMATHTHSGPGRLIDKPYWQVIQDYFWPELYVRVVDALEGVVLDAVADLEPARLGFGVAQTTDLHNDRRCANPEEDEPALPVLRVDRLSDGQTKAVAVFHAIHGTLLSMREYALSQDASGGLEAKIAERFDHPVQVMFVQGAAADMAPGSPHFDPPADAAQWNGAFDRAERLGRRAADVVMAMFDDIEMSETGVIHARTERVAIDRDILGYDPAEFRWEHGAVYCGAGYDERCVGEPPNPDLLRGCLPFPTAESAAPKQAPLTIGRIGDYAFVTAPGEFSTALGRRAREGVEASLGLPVLFLGYAQEYTGYNLAHDDWWQGGYESSGAMWGPRQGDHFVDAIIELGRSYAQPRRPLGFPQGDLEPVPGPYDDFEPFPVMPSPVEAGVLTDAPEAAAAGEVVRVTFAGGDPWLGNPLVTLEAQDGEGWAPVTWPDGRRVTSDDYSMVLSLVPDPVYEDDEATARTFQWTVELPTVRPAGGGPDVRGRTLRLTLSGRILVDGADAPADYAISSRAFTVAP